MRTAKWKAVLAEVDARYGGYPRRPDRDLIQRMLLEAFDEDAAAAVQYGQAAVDNVRGWQDRLFPVLMNGI